MVASILGTLLDPATAARLVALSDRQTAVRIPFKRGHAPTTWRIVESLFVGYGEPEQTVPVKFKLELASSHDIDIEFDATFFSRDARYPKRVTLMGLLTDDSRARWKDLRSEYAYAAAKIAPRGPSGLLVLPRELWAAIADTYSHMHQGPPHLPDQDEQWKKV